MGDDEEGTGEGQDLRTALANNARLRLELLGTISRLLRDHNVDISDDLVSRLTLATDSEVDTGPFHLMDR